MPLQDVDIQEMPGWKGALAEGADVPVQRVVVVLVAFQCVKDLAAPRDVATEFRHLGSLRHLAEAGEDPLEVEVPVNVPILEERVVGAEAEAAGSEREG